MLNNANLLLTLYFLQTIAAETTMQQGFVSPARKRTLFWLYLGDIV
jgi:hypothetical protein